MTQPDELQAAASWYLGVLAAVKAALHESGCLVLGSTPATFVQALARRGYMIEPECAAGDTVGAPK
jgi:hypothetical protein